MGNRSMFVGLDVHKRYRSRRGRPRRRSGAGDPARAARAEALPKVVRDIAWKAQLRLTARFRRLVARG